MVKIEVCTNALLQMRDAMLMYPQNDAKGAVIAEGELLTLSIRLFSELLLGRYSVDIPAAEESLLARHAHGLMAENAQMLASIGDHRSPDFNTLILPQSQLVIEAIGHAFAYSEAKKANLPLPILEMYECVAMRHDPAWYAEAGLSRAEQRMKDDRAVTMMLPNIQTYLTALNVAEFITAPIISDTAWKEYVAGLPTHTGRAVSSDEIPLARL